MDSASKPQEAPLTSPPTAPIKPRITVRPIEAIYFVIGLVVLLTAAFLVHAHPGPYAIDLQTTLEVQSFPSIRSSPD